MLSPTSDPKGSQYTPSGFVKAYFAAKHLYQYVYLDLQLQVQVVKGQVQLYRSAVCRSELEAWSWWAAASFNYFTVLTPTTLLQRHHLQLIEPIKTK